MAVTRIRGSAMDPTAAAGTSRVGTGHVERRDLTTRAMRDAVAAWCSLDPARLATLDSATVERMARRLEGRRSPRNVEGGAQRPSCGHPWAG